MLAAQPFARALARLRSWRGVLRAAALAAGVGARACPSGVACRDACCPFDPYDPGDPAVCTDDGCCRRSRRCDGPLGHSLCCAAGETCRVRSDRAGWLGGAWCCKETPSGGSCRG